MRNREPQYDAAVQSAKELFLLKNYEYHDAIRFGGMRGVVYEMISIAARLQQVDVNPNLTQERKNEIFRDKLLDAINYGTIGMMMLDDKNYEGEPLCLT